MRPGASNLQKPGNGDKLEKGVESVGGLKASINLGEFGERTFKKGEE